MSVDRFIVRIPSLSIEVRKAQKENAEKTLKHNNPVEREKAQLLLEAYAAFEEQEKATHSKLRDEQRLRTDNLPLLQRIIEAFSQVPISDAERKIIQVALDFPCTTSSELPKQLGWDGSSSWHLHFGKMCHDREYLLGTAETDSNGKPFYTGLLCDYDQASSSFTLKPEAVAAFAELGLAAKPKKKTI
ncbi:hypothetical protein KIH24_05635 [Rhizobiales bacterium TNE-4]|nr:hypothetical protein [Rhizobiales bacterium TNE-4]MBV1827104.1 hypothetical protein [Rhizobiales bacterium TNE-4]